MLTVVHLTYVRQTHPLPIPQLVMKGQDIAREVLAVRVLVMREQVKCLRQSTEALYRETTLEHQMHDLTYGHNMAIMCCRKRTVYAVWEVQLMEIIHSLSTGIHSVCLSSVNHKGFPWLFQWTHF